MDPIKKVLVLGGGSAGFMVALALKKRIPALQVVVIRSKDIPIIGVGEGSTIGFTKFLNEYIRVGLKNFYKTARPTWKLGTRFIWGPRENFSFGFGPGMEMPIPSLPKNVGFYCQQDMSHLDNITALMTHDRIFERGINNSPKLHNCYAYHLENINFVRYIEELALAMGVEILDDTVREVRPDDAGVASLEMASGARQTADLYVDCSGFVSLLLGKALGEPFISYKSTLFCERAIVGGWARGADEPIKPYTTAQTMDAGWAWQIEHEERVNRGYVYCADFISDEAAEREFRAKNPKIDRTRLVKFVSGRYQRAWVKNVVGIGNAGGFVEPLEATALSMISQGAQLLTETLRDSQGHPTQVLRDNFNDFHARTWDSIRNFLAVHYRHNTRLDTEFWRHCRANIDLAGAGPVVETFKAIGPNNFWSKTQIDAYDPFRAVGYFAVLVGQQVPYRAQHQPSDRELVVWKKHCAEMEKQALHAMTVRQALDAIHAPNWQWAS